MNGLIKTIILLVIAALILVAGYLAFFKDRDKDANSTPTPSPTVTLPGFTSTPQPTPTPTSATTKTPTPLPTATPTPISQVRDSGINGIATLNGVPKASIAVPIKNSNSVLITTAYTDSNGRFSVKLNPGTYIVGPFNEPSTSATVNSGAVLVNNGYYSEIQIQFFYQ